MNERKASVERKYKGPMEDKRYFQCLYCRTHFTYYQQLIDHLYEAIRQLREEIDEVLCYGLVE
jgi:hypothetical protein